MFRTVVLICNLSDPSACDVRNALDVIPLQPTRSAQRCGFAGQTTIAATSITPRSEMGEYEKIVCERLLDRRNVTWNAAIIEVR